MPLSPARRFALLQLPLKQREVDDVQIWQACMATVPSRYRDIDLARWSRNGGRFGAA
jgi:hypothetical protein